MIQSEKCGHSARPTGVTEDNRHRLAADTIYPPGGDEGRVAPIPNESEGVPLAGFDAKVSTNPQHDFCLDWGQYSPPPTPTKKNPLTRDWERLESIARLVFCGRVQPYQYNLVLEELGFSRFLRLSRADVLAFKNNGGL
jgi:hypothetical protein